MAFKLKLQDTIQMLNLVQKANNILIIYTGNSSIGMLNLKLTCPIYENTTRPANIPQQTVMIGIAYEKLVKLSSFFL